MTTPTEAILSALKSMTVFNTNEQVAAAVLAELHKSGFRIVDTCVDEPYVPNENTVRLSMADWRRINRGD